VFCRKENTLFTPKIGVFRSQMQNRWTKLQKRGKIPGFFDTFLTLTEGKIFKKTLKNPSKRGKKVKKGLFWL
jgi:hypothetical protein